MINFPAWKSRKRLRSSRPSSSKVQITDLPISIIQHILEFLPVKDAIQFCTLSRQWDSLWKSISNLSFNCESTEWDEVSQFSSFVDKALMVYASTEIKNFSLKINLDFDCIRREQIESWLSFATSHEVEELCLHFTGNCYYNDLPSFLYANCPATRMSLVSFDLDVNAGSFCWSSLKVLSLTETRYNSETIRAILVGSPLIESLTLRECELRESTGKIDASGTSLKELVIDSYMGYAFGLRNITKQMNISAPNLLSLTVVGYFDKIKLKLLDVSSLTEATIHLKTKMNGVLTDHEKKMLKGLLTKLTHVKKLVIGIKSLQALSIMKLSDAKFPTLTAKILKIDMELMKGYLPGVVALLLSCPDMEHLAINVIPSKADGFKLDLDDECFVLRYHLLRRMKNIKITGFVAGSCSSSDKIFVELVQHFLTSAKGLKNLIIHAEEDNLTSKPEKALKLLEITERLLCFRRASPNATIVFKSGLQ